MPFMAPKHDTKKASRQDWHPADILAALRKQGWSLRRLGKTLGVAHQTLSSAFARSYPAAEERIAAVLGVHPSVIWPSRYYADGSPRGRGGYPNRRAPIHEPTHIDAGVNVSLEEAA